MKKRLISVILSVMVCVIPVLNVAATETSADAREERLLAVTLEDGENTEESDEAEAEESSGWIQDSQGWWYRRADGSYPASCWEMIDEQWYYFNGKGYRTTGWQKIGGYWYYMDDAGAMKTGWQTLKGVTYYLKDSGRMSVGWVKIEGNWYYFQSSGSMVANGWQKISGKWYYFEEDGIMKTGWLGISGKWYYLSESGAMATGWQKIGGQWYYLTGSGVMVTGWQKIGGKWYCFDSDGVMITGWGGSKGKWYYLGSDGAMRTSQWIGDYYVGSDGAMLTSTWIGPYYVDSTGKWVRDQYYTIQLGNGKTTTVYGHLDHDAANRVISLLNQYRASYGLNTLEVDTALTEAVHVRAPELAYSFSHDRPDGSDCFSAINEFFWAEGENIAMGYTTPESVMTGWKNSPGHNANMLDNYNCVGVGVFVKVSGSSKTYYWVQMFGYK